MFTLGSAEAWWVKTLRAFPEDGRQWRRRELNHVAMILFAVINGLSLFHNFTCLPFIHLIDEVVNNESLEILD